MSRVQHLVFTLLAVSACSLPHIAAQSGLWSLSLGPTSLFNIPELGRSFLKSVGVGPENLLNTVDFHSRVDPNVLEDSHLTTPELINKYGFPSEIHHTITDDGYILELHRIVRKDATPVLLMHGLLDSSATWVMMGPDKGLAYLLYNSSYDVWMPNVRGNTYSRNHTKYSTKHAKFWDFTFHEIAKYDLPASIDYILAQTGQERLQYIGHSQGTMTFWIMCSERPEYSDKIISMQALAPIAYIKHSKSPVVDFLAYFQEPIGILLKLIGAHEFLPSTEFRVMFSQLICDEDVITMEICSNILFLIVGFDKSEANETMLPVVLGHSPAGASTKQMQHYGQLKRSGEFRQFDYGWIRNYWIYNQITPPNYNLKKVRSKVALHYSQNDWLATPIDIEDLHVQLPNVIGKFLVSFPKFNHLDFVWGVDARKLLYDRILRLMKLVERGDL
ncbi:lipase 3-like [Rhagoletis pomonella]|uniref:lipase 3-like n=1 Tax=Rhagoletis pomonella TaxID=28610 RepID=UPI00177DC535|nr:lipase 3-like [Rhagoletis pomonella]